MSNHSYKSQVCWSTDYHDYIHYSIKLIRDRLISKLQLEIEKGNCVFNLPGYSWVAKISNVSQDEINTSVNGYCCISQVQIKTTPYNEIDDIIYELEKDLNSNTKNVLYTSNECPLCKLLDIDNVLSIINYPLDYVKLWNWPSQIPFNLELDVGTYNIRKRLWKSNKKLNNYEYSSLYEMKYYTSYNIIIRIQPDSPTRNIMNQYGEFIKIEPLSTQMDRY